MHVCVLIVVVEVVGHCHTKERERYAKDKGTDSIKERERSANSRKGIPSSKTEGEMKK